MCAQGEIQLDIEVPNQTRYLRLIGNIAEQVVHALDNYSGDKEALAFQLNLVLTEAMVNAIRHADPEDRDKTVRVCIRIEEKELLVRVYDQGQGFDLQAIPMPDFDDLSENGRGIFIIRTLMDGVDYRRTERGNVLEMHKKLD